MESLIAMTKPRIAVVLFNLGGPDNQEAVQPFLFNLFNDPAIIGLPNPFRFLLAKLISSRRAPVAKEIYHEMGGGSPLLPLTEAQADALKEALSAEWDAEVFISMRYWHPRADETVKKVKAFAPERIIALSLYPQYSTTTIASSFRDWQRFAKKQGLNVPTDYICSYPTEPDFIASHAALIRAPYEEAKKQGKARILFSAHGLPEKVIQAGDPYQKQVEETTQAVLKALDFGAEVDYVNCYQSRVGPLKWIGPSTDDEIKRAGAEGVPLVVIPIAFVSEHSETLVELDIEYGKLAKESGVPFYTRVPALGTETHYIRSLANLCKAGLGTKCCGNQWTKCPCTAA